MAMHEHPLGGQQCCLKYCEENQSLSSSLKKIQYVFNKIGKVPKYNMSLTRCGEQVIILNKHVHEFGPKV